MVLRSDPECLKQQLSFVGAAVFVTSVWVALGGFQAKVVVATS